jgi:hypothetical protein
VLQDANWTHEKGLVAGPRVTHADVAALLQAMHAALAAGATPASLVLVADLPGECDGLVGAHSVCKSAHQDACSLFASRCALVLCLSAHACARSPRRLHRGDEHGRRSGGARALRPAA